MSATGASPSQYGRYPNNPAAKILRSSVWSVYGNTAPVMRLRLTRASMPFGAVAADTAVTVTALRHGRQTDTVRAKRAPLRRRAAPITLERERFGSAAE